MGAFAESLRTPDSSMIVAKTTANHLEKYCEKEALPGAAFKYPRAEMAQQLAEEDGYDIILMNDSVLEIPENPENIVREISNRRILFARSQMDITDQLIQRMNADYQASADSK